MSVPLEDTPMYAITRFHLVSLFSHRVITANALTARTLPCPTPAAVKLALLARLIERDASGRTLPEIAEVAQTHLDWLAPLRVAWGAPVLVAIGAATMRVWKGDSADEPLTSTVGMREYAHFGSPFGLALGPVITDVRRGDLDYALAHLRALGVAESLVQPLAPPIWRDTVPDGFTWLTDDAGAGMAGATEASVLDDLGSAPSFARLSVYRPNERDAIPRLGEDRRRRVVMLPLRQRRAALSGRTLERVAGSEWEVGMPYGGA
jgi:hypothetical protein